MKKKWKLIDFIIPILTASGLAVWETYRDIKSRDDAIEDAFEAVLDSIDDDEKREAIKKIKKHQK